MNQELFNPAVFYLSCFLCASAGWILGACFKHISCRNAEFRAWREAERLFRAREEQRLRDAKDTAPAVPGSLITDLVKH